MRPSVRRVGAEDSYRKAFEAEVCRPGSITAFGSGRSHRTRSPNLKRHIPKEWPLALERRCAILHTEAGYDGDDGSGECGRRLAGPFTCLLRSFGSVSDWTRLS